MRKPLADVCHQIMGLPWDRAEDIIFANDYVYRILSFDGVPCKLDTTTKIGGRISLRLVADLVMEAYPY